MSESAGNPRGLSIFTKTFLTVMVVALIPVATLGIRNVMSRQAVTTASVDQVFEQEAKLVAANVSGWLDLSIRVLHHDALLPEIRSSNPDRQRSVLYALMNSFPWMTVASTVGSDGKNITRSDTGPLLDYANYEYFRTAVSGKDLGYELVISKVNGKPSLVLATPYPAAGGKVEVLMVTQRLSSVAEVVAATKIGSTGFSFLLDEKGKVVAHRGAEYQDKLGDLSQHPAYLATRSTDKARVIFQENGKEYIAHALVTRLGWVVVVQQETSEAFAAVDEAVRSAIMVVAGVAVLALLAAFLLARALTKPIRRLTELADAISRGETSAQIAEVERGDEIGGLARAIDRMRISIDVAMKRLRRNSGASPE